MSLKHGGNPPSMCTSAPHYPTTSSQTAICSDSHSKLQPAINFLRRLSTKLAKKTTCLMAVRRSRSSRRVSSSSLPASTCSFSSYSSCSQRANVLERSRSCTADPIVNESHRAQAIEDCIQFVKHSSSVSLHTSSGRGSVSYTPGRQFN